MIQKAYFEITNVCNLHCSFCPGTQRKPHFVSVAEFEQIAQKLAGKIPYLYLHLMGEPTLHPALAEILDIAHALGFKTILTTNGTTCRQTAPILLAKNRLFKVSISLHSFEANHAAAADASHLRSEYWNACFAFADQAAREGIICALRLWNLENADASGQTQGEQNKNHAVLAQMKQYFGSEWQPHRCGMKLRDHLFLEYGERFEWPNPDANLQDRSTEENGEALFCHGLRDQIGILCDGRVVPCCLDREGSVTLGNLLTDSLEDILHGEKAREFYRCFSQRKAPSPLCSSCGFARRFR